MTIDSEASKGWKQKLIHEMTEYWIIFLYLAVFFGVFLTYQRLLLDAYEISYLHYGFGLLQAAVLAKVILIGDALRLGRRLEDRPLMVVTLYKTVIFSLWMTAFKVLEEGIRGLLQGRGLTGDLHGLIGTEWYVVIAHALVVVAALVPFFAIRELGRVMGEGKLRALFFRQRTEAGS